MQTHNFLKNMQTHNFLKNMLLTKTYAGTLLWDNNRWKSCTCYVFLRWQIYTYMYLNVYKNCIQIYMLCMYTNKGSLWQLHLKFQKSWWSDNSLICSSTPRGFFVKIKKVNFGKEVRLSPLDGNKRKTIDIGPFSPFWEFSSILEYSGKGCSKSELGGKRPITF